MMLAIQNVKLKMSHLNNMSHKYSLTNRKGSILSLILQLRQIELVRGTNKTHTDLSIDIVLHNFSHYI